MLGLPRPQRRRSVVSIISFFEFRICFGFRVSDFGFLAPMPDRRLKFLLLASVFAIATCGLVYELIAGTLASYLLGDSVTQFSTIIGVYLFAMGIGSYLSRFGPPHERTL